MTRLHDLHEAGGQSPWLDNLRRDWLQSGELGRWVERGVRGVTSNPSIFQKAFTATDAYDEQFAALGIDTRKLKFIVVKNPMNYQQAYAGAPAMIVLDTPGPTPSNLASVNWQRLTRPCFPVDDGFEPVFATA